MWVQYDPNPVRSDGVGDCSVRAIAKALDIPWGAAHARLALNSFLMGDVMSSDIVWGSILRKEGYSRQTIPDTCPDCYTIQDFCRDHPKGTFVLKSAGHVATVIDGNLYDSWNSEMNVPVYFWYKPSEERKDE